MVHQNDFTKTMLFHTFQLLQKKNDVEINTETLEKAFSLFCEDGCPTVVCTSNVNLLKTKKVNNEPYVVEDVLSECQSK